MVKNLFGLGLNGGFAIIEWLILLAFVRTILDIIKFLKREMTIIKDGIVLDAVEF